MQYEDLDVEEGMPRRQYASDSNFPSKIGEYLKSDTADVHFRIVGTGEVIPAHKMFLSSRSNIVFDESLTQDYVEIVDVSAEAFKEFLRFFYFDNVRVSVKYVEDVMTLGKKYDVEACVRACRKLFAKNFTTENVIPAYKFAIRLNDTQLLTSCTSEIQFNSSEILKSQSFLRCDRKILKHILEMDRLSCSEAEIFHACVKWVQFHFKRTNREEGMFTDHIDKSNLGDSFYAIRFGSMSLYEFEQLVQSYGSWFTEFEREEISRVIFHPEYQSKWFKGNRRLPFWDDKKTIFCDRSTDHSAKGLLYSVSPEFVTTFSTNRALLLGKLVCTALFNAAGEIVNVKKVTATIGKTKSLPLTQFSFDMVDYSAAHGFVAVLPKPFLIQPGVKHYICLKFPSSQFYAQKTHSETVEPISNIVVQFKEKPSVICGLEFNLLD